MKLKQTKRLFSFVALLVTILFVQPAAAQSTTTTTTISATDDYGDSCAAAYPVQINTAINGAINRTYDNDYFVFQVPAAGRVKIYVTDLTCDWVYFYLYNSNCDSYIASAFGYNGDFIEMPVEPGTYYLSLYSSNKGNYALHLEFFSQNDLGSISGRITNMQQEGVAGVEVQVYRESYA